MTKLKLPPHLAKLNPLLASSREPLTMGDGYRSNLERRVALEWIPAQANVAKWLYEPITFHLAGGRYTPDFMLFSDDPRPLFVEAKGWTQSLRADRRAFLEACHTHLSWSRWLWLTWDKRAGWEERWEER